MHQTLFLTSFHSYVSRNIHSTDFLEILRVHKDLRIILLVPQYKLNFFKERFERGNVEVVGVMKTGWSTRTLRGLFFRRFSELAHVSETNTIKWKLKFHHTKSVPHLLAALIIGFIGRFHTVRRFVRFLDLHLSPRGVFEPLIEKYKPSLIFAADVFNENDALLMQSGQRAGIPTIGFVRSWDNPSKYLLRVFPGKILTGSSTLAQEMRRFHHYPKGRITVVGNPHYDRYRKGPTEDRATFFRHLGFDPMKPMVLFSPVGDDLIHFNDFDQHIMEILAKTGYQVLVRFPPASAVRVVDFTPPKTMYIDKPGVAFDGTIFTDREITPEQDSSLVNALYHCDLAITGPSSIPLDASFFDKPCIVADFYPTSRGRLDAIYEYEYYHIRKLFKKTNGVWYVKSKEEFLKAIEAFLKDKTLYREGREKIRSMWFSHDDGSAGKRLAAEVLSSLG